MERRTIIRIIAVIFAVVGIGVFTYPYVAQKVFVLKSQNRIEEFDTYIRSRQESNQVESDKEVSIDKTTDETIDYLNIDATDQQTGSTVSLAELHRQMVAYNENLYLTGQSDLKDPFSFEQVDFDMTRYGFQENMIGYLQIPKMDNIILPIYLGASTENMSKGAAHMSQTSLPVGGNNTNSVIAAHRDMGTAIMFNGIEKLVIGDNIILTNFMETLTYQVSEIKIITPTQVGEIMIQEDQDLLTLITCHPFGHNYQRYIVYCKRI